MSIRSTSIAEHSVAAVIKVCRLQYLTGGLRPRGVYGRYVELLRWLCFIYSSNRITTLLSKSQFKMLEWFFGKSFNPDQDIPSLAGKVILITGGSSGHSFNFTLALLTSTQATPVWERRPLSNWQSMTHRRYSSQLELRPRPRLPFPRSSRQYQMARYPLLRWI